MPFTIKDTLSFSLAFLLASVSLYSFSSTVTLIQVIIADLCLNMTACYKDLQIMFSQLDKFVNEELLNPSNNGTVTDLTEKLRDIVTFHQQVFL